MSFAAQHEDVEILPFFSGGDDKEGKRNLKKGKWKGSVGITVTIHLTSGSCT